MRIFILSFLLLMSSIVKAQIKISAQKDIKYKDYKTFAIQKGQIISTIAEQKINESQLFEVLKKSISREMTLRGYTLANDSTADLIVTYVFEEADQSTYEKPGPLGQTPKDDPTDVNEIDRSTLSRTLIIDIVARRKRDSLWTATCSLRNGRDVYRSIDETTAQAFQKFLKLTIRR